MMAQRILLMLLLLAIPALGQDENVWNVYCNGDNSKCSVAKEPSGEFLFAVFSTPVTWDDAWAWMNENGFPAQPTTWNVYCNGDRSKCSVAKEPSGEFMFAVFSTPVTWDDAWAWMSANGFPAQPAAWNVYCNGDQSKCSVAKEPSGEFMFAVFSTPVTWDDAWAWMSANGFPAQPEAWNVYCNGDRSRCAVAKEASGDFVYPVFSTPVTWDDAWAWMKASGFSAIDGAWTISTPISADMTLTSQGNRITGTYSFNRGQGSIEGILDHKVWTGTWSDPTGNGEFSVTFSDDAASFSGNWKYSTSASWDGVFEAQKRH